LFQDIAKRYDIDLHGVPAVGDSLRDLQASYAVGCKPWLVQTGNGAKTIKLDSVPPNTQFAADLSAAVDQILSGH
jgi:D-glycero-D-manno-heptose 1,7-bisphosphate phosphatase